MRLQLFTTLLSVLFVLLSFCSATAQDNLVVEYDGATGLPNFLNICGEPDTARVKIRVSGLAIEEREDILATVQLFQGARFVEFISSESDPNITLTGSELNSATFSIPDLDPFATTEVNLAFALKADCSYADTINQNNSAFVADTWTLNYTMDGSSMTETEMTATYKDAFAIPNLTISSANNVAISSIGECFDRNIVLSNSGLSGFIDSLNFSATYGAGVSISKVKINGIEVPIVKVPNGTDTLYQFVIAGVEMQGNTLGAGMGDGDQSLDPNESLTITETVCVLSCTENRGTDYTASWGCYGAVCETETMSNFVTIGSGAPNPIATNAGTVPNQNTGYCQEGSQTIAFKNEGTEADAGYGTMKDVQIAVGWGNNLLLQADKYEITSITIAGVTINTDTSVVQLDTIAAFTTDPDGANGLIDQDGDGYFDDLPIGETIEVVVGYRFRCGNAQETDMACSNNAVESMNSQISYTDACADRIVLINNSVVRPSNISPDSESSTDTDANIATETFHVKYFQLRTATNFSKMGCGGNEQFIITVDLPQGVTINTAETQFTRNQNYTYPLVSSNQNGTVLELIYDASASSFIGGEYGLNLAFNSDCTASPGATSFPVTLSHYCGACDCRHTWFCGELEGPVLHPSVPPCNNLPPCPNGVRALSFDVSRTTLGYTDETYTTKVDVDSANTKVALSCDSVAMSFVTVVGDDVITNDVGAIINYDNPEEIAGTEEIFLFDKGIVEVRRQDGTTGTALVNSTAATVEAIDLHKKVDIELDAALQNIGLTLNPGDTILFRAMFSLNPDGPYNEQFKIVPNLRGEMYHTFGGEQKSCDNYGAEFTVAKTSSLFVFPSSPSYPKGCKETDLEYKIVVYNNDFNSYYPSEFIPAASTDSIKFTFDTEMLNAFEDKTVEVMIPNHPIHGNNFFEIPSLDAFQNGEYIARFDTLDFIPSYNNSFAAMFTLRVNLVANCSSMTGSSNGNNLFTFRPTIYYRDRVYAESIGDGSCAKKVEETINNDILYTKPPTFSLQALTNPNPQVNSDTVRWTFKHCNTSTESDAGLNWLALDFDHSSFTILSVQDIGSNTPQDLTLQPYGNGNSVFMYVDSLQRNFITNTSNDICNTYLVTARFNNCGNYPVTVRTGWNCGLYDETNWTPALYPPCNQDTLNISAKTLEGALDAEVVAQTTDTVQLCNTLTYEIVVKNTDLGNIKDIETVIELPFEGLDFVPNSFQLAYPASGTLQDIPSPTLVSNTPEGQVYTYPNFNNLHTFLNNNGLEGFNAASPSDSTEYKLRFQVVPGCNYVSGQQIQYRFQGESICGDSTNTAAGETFPIYIQAVPKSTQFFLANFNSATQYNPDGTGTIGVTVSNTTAAPTDANDVIRVILPPNVTYTPNSVAVTSPTTWTPSAPTSYVEDGFNVLIWNMPIGVPQGGNIDFTFEVSGAALPTCAVDTFSFSLLTADLHEVACATSGETCRILSTTTEGGEKFLDLVVSNGINYNILSATSTCVSNDTEAVTIAGTITGLPMQNADGTLSFYHDVNNNDSLDIGTDEILATAIIPTGTTGSFAFSENFNVTHTQLCNVLASATFANAGTCPVPAAVEINPSLQNAGDATVACGNTVTLGNNDCNNISSYTYQWTAISPATITSISDATSPNPVLTLDGTMTNGAVLQYVLETTRVGCNYKSKDTINVTVSSAVDVNIQTSTNPNICLGDNITLTAVATGASSISWSDGTNQVGTNTTLSVNPSSSTTYTVIATNAEGCTATSTTIINVNPDVTACSCVPTTITGVSVTQAQCGESTGAATVNITGNLTDYSFNWSNGATTSTNTGLVAGTYQVTISENANDTCITTTTVVVGNSDAATPSSVSTTPATCTNNDGTATILPATWTYAWSDGGTGNIRTDLAQGIYGVTVTDPSDSSCFNVIPVTILENNNLEVSHTTTAPTCGNNDGVVSLNITGGTGNYNITWSDGGTGDTRTGLSAGTYMVNVQETDGQQCATSYIFALVDSDVPQVTITLNQVNDITCVGEQNGSVDFSVNIPMGINVPLDTIITSGVANHTNGQLAAGQYCIEIKDANGCVNGAACFEIQAPEPIMASVATTASCADGGTATVQVSGGTGVYTFDWADLAGTNNNRDRTHLSAGDYQLTITDTNGCQLTLTSGITIPACPCTVEPQVKSVVIQEATCGNADGTATLSIIPNTAGLTYSWSPDVGISTGDGNIRTNLPAGGYTVTVSDASGHCSDVFSFAISNEDAPALTAPVVTTPSDCGSTNGTATLSPASYNYIWSDNGTGNVRNDLAAGVYFVSISEPGNPSCIAVEEIEIENNNSLDVNVNITTAATCGNADGEVTATVTGGSGNYAYEWSFGTATTANVSGVPSGIYTLTVTDLNTACQGTTTFVLNDGDVPSATINIIHTSHVSCEGQNDGGIIHDIVTDAGFQEPYNLVVSNGNGVFQNGNLAGGDYCMAIYDANNCLAGSTCFTIEENKGLEAAFSVTNACNNQGEIDLTVSHGASPYTYNWEDVAGNDNTQDRNQLSAGNYTVTITDANGCTLVSPVLAITCDECELNLNIESVMITEATCGNTDGVATVITNSDTSNLTYTWTPNVGTSVGNGNIKTNLPAGAYTVVVQDGTGLCSDSISFAITNADAPELDAPITTTAADCNANNGTATLSPSTYNYTWSDGGTGHIRNDLAAGTHFVSFTDANNPNCEGVVEVVIETNSTLQLNTNILAAPTCGNNDGSASVAVVGGSGNYSYQWSNGETTANITHLLSGTYSVTVTDNDAPLCTAITTLSLIDSNADNFNIVLNSITNITCNGANNGAVDVTVTPNTGYTTVISDGTNTFQNGQLPAGNYCINVIDANACVAAATCFEIEENPALETEFSVSGGCNNDGNIQVTATGGTGTYTYNWADLAGSDNNPNRSNLSAGAYAVTITDSNGCSQSNNAILVDCPVATCTNPIEVTSTLITEATCGNTDGAVNIQLNVNPASLTFTWLPNVGTSGATDNIRTNLPAGGYTVTITDSLGVCETVTYFAVNNSDAPALDANPQITNADCGAANGTVVLTPSTYNYTWSDGGTGDTRNDLATGTYFATFTDAANPSCEGVVEVEIGLNNQLEVEVTVNTAPTCGNSDGTVTATVPNGTGNYTFVWSNGNTGANISGLSSGTYQVTVSDATQPLCIASTAVVLVDSDITQVPVTINNMSHITCNGADNGTVDYTANVPAGMTAIITDGTNTFQNGQLPAGNYCINIIDANGCVGGGACFEIEDASPIQVEYSISNACDNNGSITIHATGGTGNFTFDWLDMDGTDNGGTRTNLSTGLYSVIISDSNNCTVLGYQLPINCTECPTQDLIDYTLVHESECGESTGVATVYMNGNPSQYTYNWIPSTGTTNSVGNQLSGLAAGVYQVIVQDTSNLACLDSVYIAVTNANAPTASLLNTTATPCGSALGTATLSPSTFTYNWSDGGTGDTRDDLAAGTYTVIYYDSADTACYNVLLVEIADSTNWGLTANITQQADCRVSNGAVTIETAVTGNYTYLWSDGGTGETRNNLAAGTYTVVVSNENGCTDQITFTIVNNVAETAIISNLQATDIACENGIGSVDFDITYTAAFVQPAEVILSSGFTTWSPDSLPQGNYCITIQDGDGCFVTSECFEIKQAETLEIGIVANNVGCTDTELGALTVNVTGGTLPYTYDWADIDTSPEPKDRTQLSAGTYNLTVTDAQGCSVIANGITVDSICQTPVCDFFNGMDTTSLTSAACGDTTLLCTGLEIAAYASGNYTVLVDGDTFDITTDVQTCESSVLSAYPNLIPGQGFNGPYNLVSWTVNGVTHSGEFAHVNALIDSLNTWDDANNWELVQNNLIIMGGNPSSTYSNMMISALNNPAQVFTLPISSTNATLSLGIPLVGEGLHEIVIVDNSANCPDTLIVTMNCPELNFEDEILIGDSTVYCFDVNQVIAGTALTGDSIVSIQNVCPENSGTSSNFYVASQNPPCISYTGLTPGVDTACWLVCDENGICDTVNYVVTVVPSGPSVYIDTLIVPLSDTICLDGLTNLCGEIQAVNNFCDDNSSTVSFTYLNTDDDFCIIYTANQIGLDSACLEIIDEYGNADTVYVYIHGVSNVTPETVCDTIVVGQSVQYCLDTTELTAPVASIINDCPSESGQYAEFFLEEGTWCVTYEGVADVGKDSACVILCDENGVCDTTYFCITVRKYFGPPIAVDDYDTTQMNVPIVINEKENDTVLGGIDSLYVLSGPQIGTATVNLDCTITYEPNEGVCAVTDSFSYVICNPNACDTATVFIYIECTELTIFNALSPNGDGLNDVFYIDGINEFPNNRLCIYNRWGLQVYEKRGYNNEWNGKWGGYDLPSGTYFYVLNLGDDKNTTRSGYIQIHR